MKDAYHVQIDTELMMRLEWEGLSRNEMAHFFSAQLEGIIRCPYNVTVFQQPTGQMFMLGSALNPGIHPIKQKAQRSTVPAWVLRGFYPGTNIFFRMTVIDCENSTYMQGYGARYYAKVRIPRIKPKKINDHYGFNGNIVRENNTKIMENVMLGADHQLEEVMKAAKVRNPKCMSPKGMPLLKRKKRRAKP